MKLVHVAAAVLNQTPLDWEGNKRRILAAIDEARRQGASILCLPELCISGYGCEDMFLSPGMHETARQVLLEIVPHTRGMIVSLGLPVRHHYAVYNAACLVADGRLLGFTSKQNLAGDGIHYEPRWFKPWPASEVAETEFSGERYLFGDVYYDCGGIRLGFEICEDAWVASRPGTALAARGVDIILNPSASHFAFGKAQVRERFVLEGSRAFGVSYVYSNLLGNEAGRAIYDGGALVASNGVRLAAGKRFSFADYLVTSATVDIDATRMRQAQTGSHRHRTQPDGGCVRAEFSYPRLQPSVQAEQIDAWEQSPEVKAEEFARAVSLGLFDYLRKSRSHGFVLSLSGGADSASIAVLVWLMTQFSVGELGLEGMLEKLSYSSRLRSAGDLPSLMRLLLTCAYQSTENSSEVTRSAARQVAEAVGASYLEFDVDAIVKQYTSIVAEGIGRPLNWQQDDVALQNIQARVRAPSVWMLANLHGALLVSTSNRSEAAVGYATMDGDTSGGLSPIAGIDKAYLRRWLRWMETTGPHGLHPIPALAAVNVQAPTAELRPQGAKQTDEDDLMPYDLLDAIERAAIRDKHTPLECYLLLRASFPQYTSEQLHIWVERFFLLWCRNQWKRERYAPSFHLDDQNLDPKTWCRFPILSGGFQRELAELRNYLAER